MRRSSDGLLVDRRNGTSSGFEVIGIFAYLNPVEAVVRRFHLVASVNRALSTGNDGHGINFDENRTGNGSSDTEGDLTASVSNSTSTGNTGAGVRADQQIPLGVGSLLLTDVTALPNTGGATTGSNVTVTVAP